MEDLEFGSEVSSQAATNWHFAFPNLRNLNEHVVGGGSRGMVDTWTDASKCKAQQWGR